MAPTIAARYAALAAEGTIDRDAAQEALAARFDVLAAALADYRLARRPSALGRLFGQRRTAPRGLYVWGAVGRGKTLLMDLFFEAAPVRRKRRVHFHAFMTEVHARIHAARQAAGAGGGDPIPPVAAALADEAWLLAFDEFQVTDIADAMILGRLFERLFEAGVVVVATSNVEPHDLYRDGLNRALFLPFVAMLEARLDIVRLEARTDYRLDKLAGVAAWHVPADREARAALDDAFRRLTGGGRAEPEVLRVQGRDLVVPRAARGVARFGFADLCAAALGPADYLAIAERYHTLLIDGIPRLRAEERNPTRRFIVLVDTLYDHRVKLIASAAAEPQDLLAGGPHAFEFERTVSRLIEMRSQDWLALPHGREDKPSDPGTAGLVET
jgi:cell division protein ZapE